MDEYALKLYPTVAQELENIYAYIVSTAENRDAARRSTERLKNAILTLRVFPNAHQIRMEGRYGGKEYRQLLVGPYIVIYKVDEQQKTVYVGLFSIIVRIYDYCKISGTSDLFSTHRKKGMVN